MELGIRQKGTRARELGQIGKIKEVLGPSGSKSIMGIHWHEYRGTAPSPLTLVYE